jgi:mRNA-degrading endonuclease RelE of RelBE toxin-antitoxin system
VVNGNLINENSKIPTIRDFRVLYRDNKGRFIDLVESNNQIRKPGKEIQELAISFVVQKEFREGNKKAFLTIEKNQGDCKQVFTDNSSEERLPNRAEIVINSKGFAELLLKNPKDKDERKNSSGQYVYLCRDCKYRLIVDYDGNKIVDIVISTT